MNKPSERIVVFVTPAQKLAIASTAERLGISVSELMRRAVLSFGATSEQVKAASIVDRLNAPREPDALNAALQRVAAASKRTNARNNAAAQALAGAKRAAAAQSDNLQDIAGAQAHDDARAPLHAAKADPTEATNPFDETDAMRDSSLPDAFAVTHPADDDTDEEAVARVTAAWRAQAGRDAADTAPGSGTRTPSPVVPSAPAAPTAVRRAKPSTLADDNEDDSSPDPTAEGGRFA